MPMIQITVGDNAVDMLKSIVSSLYMEWLDDLLELELPQEVDFDSKEEYDKACKELMLDLVAQAKEYKGDIFRGVLESYNNFLTNKHTFDSQSKVSEEEALKAIARATADMKGTGFLVLFLTLLFPTALPYLILFNGPRIMLDAKERKNHEATLENTKIVREQIKSIQDPLYWFTDSLRTDYHKSNQELEELRVKAENGENVIPRLMELMSPERLSLSRENVLKELEFIIPDEIKEEEKQYIKKEDKK